VKMPGDVQERVKKNKMVEKKTSARATDPYIGARGGREKKSKNGQGKKESKGGVR